MSSQKVTFNVQEIFTSLQGEARNTGVPTVFVRLFGCNLRCKYCDSGYYSNESIRSLPREVMTVREIAEDVLSRQITNVCITGGEPLMYGSRLDSLISLLSGQGLTVEIETSANTEVSGYLRPWWSRPSDNARYIVDIKTPCSGEHGSNKLSVFRNLSSRDDIVVVVHDRRDFDYAVNFINRARVEGLSDKVPIYFSPMNMAGNVEERTYNEDIYIQLPQWLMEERIVNARMQVQLHKYLNLP